MDLAGDSAGEISSRGVNMRTIFLRTSVLALGLVLAACAGTGKASLAPTTAPATLAPPSAAATPAPATGAIVKLASSSLGQIVADSSGRTVYAFTPDQAGGQPTCYDQCAATWPALTSAGSFTVGDGLDQSKFTTVVRTDNAGAQIKFGQYPLYYFAGDTAPGQTNGEGVGGKWFVVSAAAEQIKQ